MNSNHQPSKTIIGPLRLLCLAGLVLLPAAEALADHTPEIGCYIGAYIRLDETVKGDVNAFEGLVGKKHASYLRYVGYGAPFPFGWVKSLRQRGAIPHIAWEPNDGLSAVRDDEYLRGWAEAAAHSGGPVFLRYAAEMNGDWQAYSGDPTQYVEKWRLVCRVMREVAPNVVMIWCPFATPRATITDYYPGDEWVDWVGVNIYSVHHYDGQILKPANDDPRDLLRYVYNLYCDRKPIAICEYAATHHCAACKQDVTGFGLQQMTRLYRSLPTEFPQVKMISWFCVDAARNGLAHNDYSITTSPLMLTRYRELITDPYFLSEATGAAPSGVASAPPAMEHPLALAELGPVSPTGLDIAISGAPPNRVSGEVEILAEPGAELDVEIIMFYLDDRFHTVTNVAPYRCQWNASYYSPGPHHIKAVALDVDNNVAAERTVSAVVVAH